jgi:hypothetical protein
MHFKNSNFIIIIYILGLISLFVIEFFDCYFSKYVLLVFKTIGIITFLLIIFEAIQTRFFNKE